MPSSNMGTATIFTRPPHIWGLMTLTYTQLCKPSKSADKICQIAQYWWILFTKLTQIRLKVYYNPNPPPQSWHNNPPPNRNIHRWAVTILLECILVIVFGLTIMTAQLKLDWYSLISNSGINDTDS